MKIGEIVVKRSGKTFLARVTVGDETWLASGTTAREAEDRLMNRIWKDMCEGHRSDRNGGVS